MRVLAFAALGLLLPPFTVAASAQSGATLTPDSFTYLVNKDIGDQRWTISLNKEAVGEAAILNVTGTVFRRDGASPSFVYCQVRSESAGRLDEPESELRLACSGASACQSSATRCAQDGWAAIAGADDLRLPAGFFTSSRIAPGSESSAGPSRASSDPGRSAQDDGGGATLTPDKFNGLVTRVLGSERWSISVNSRPVNQPGGGAARRIVSITGNVFRGDSTPPAFVYCTPREDSLGDLAQPGSEFRLRCSGADACEGDFGQCSRDGWKPIADDLRISAEFFLPPEGLPGPLPSDPEILVIGRTSDPPSIVVKEFDIPASSSGVARPNQGCAVGTTCTVARFGACATAEGSLVEIEGFGCGCAIDQRSSTCSVCGAGAQGSCGGSCEFTVGAADRLVRGTCLPISASSPDCACYPLAAGQTETFLSCSGSLSACCPPGKCCADDPTDGCRVGFTSENCPGLCVPRDACDPAQSGCGSCFLKNPPEGCDRFVRLLEGDPGRPGDGRTIRAVRRTGDSFMVFFAEPIPLRLFVERGLEVTIFSGAPDALRYAQAPGINYGTARADGFERLDSQFGPRLGCSNEENTCCIAPTSTTSGLACAERNGVLGAASFQPPEAVADHLTVAQDFLSLLEPSCPPISMDDLYVVGTDLLLVGDPPEADIQGFDEIDAISVCEGPRDP